MFVAIVSMQFEATFASIKLSFFLNANIGQNLIVKIVAPILGDRRWFGEHIQSWKEILQGQKKWLSLI